MEWRPRRRECTAACREVFRGRGWFYGCGLTLHGWFRDAVYGETTTLVPNLPPPHIYAEPFDAFTSIVLILSLWNLSLSLLHSSHLELSKTANKRGGFSFC